MSDELLESNPLRNARRVKMYNERAERMAREKPKTVSQILREGGEGRMFTSKHDAISKGLGVYGTEPANASAVDATIVETGRGAAARIEAQEQARAARQPLPAYAEPTDELDPRAHPNVDEMYANDPAFRRWLENDASPEKVAKIAQIATEQRQNKVELAELDRLIPSWRDEIEAMVAWMKRTQGLTDQDLRQFFRNPSARQYAQWRERWQQAEYNAVAAKAKKTGHVRDVAEQVAALLPDETPAQRRGESAEREELMRRLRDTHRPGDTSEFMSYAEREDSLQAAAELFEKTLELGVPDETEEATDRSTLG